MRSTHRFSLPLLVAAAAALLPLIAFAADAEQRAARLVTTARAIEWHPAINPAATLLSVQRPDGEVITETFAAGRNPMLPLDGLADGVYSYELRVAQADSAPLVQSGSFTVANGAVVSPDALEVGGARSEVTRIGVRPSLFDAERNALILRHMRPLHLRTKA